MTVLADAAAVYVGDVAAVAVYQGARRIWPPWTGTAAVGAFNPSDNSVGITVGAPLSALQVPTTPIFLTFDQNSRDWASGGPARPRWQSSDMSALAVSLFGTGGNVDLAELVAHEEAPVELRWRAANQFELVFDP